MPRRNQGDNYRNFYIKRAFLESLAFEKSCQRFLFIAYSRATVDQDGDGDISKEEFIKNSMNSPFIAEVLKDRKKKNRT